MLLHQRNVSFQKQVKAKSPTIVKSQTKAANNSHGFEASLQVAA